MSTLNAPGTGLARELVAAFSTFGPRYLKWLSAHALQSGVTFARMKTLYALERSGPQIMSSLRDRLGVTARSVTALVDALEHDQMVRRVPHPHDRRATIIELTETGHRTIKGQFDAHAERAAELFAVLPEHDQAELLRIMRTLTKALNQRCDRESC